jgi:hypothetical protein
MQFFSLQPVQAPNRCYFGFAVLMNDSLTSLHIGDA